MAQESAVVGETHSINKAVKGMRTTLAARVFEIAKSTCWTHFQKAIDNNLVGVSPQKTSGLALPSHLEKRVANIVRTLRGKKFPAFREECLKWAEEAIKDTEYADYFVNGMPTIG